MSRMPFLQRMIDSIALLDMMVSFSVLSGGGGGGGYVRPVLVDPAASSSHDAVAENEGGKEGGKGKRGGLVIIGVSSPLT